MHSHTRPFLEQHQSQLAPNAIKDCSPLSQAQHHQRSVCSGREQLVGLVNITILQDLSALIAMLELGLLLLKHSMFQHV